MEINRRRRKKTQNNTNKIQARIKKYNANENTTHRLETAMQVYELMGVTTEMERNLPGPTIITNRVDTVFKVVFVSIIITRKIYIDNDCLQGSYIVMIVMINMF